MSLFLAQVEGLEFLALHHVHRVVIHVGVGAHVLDVVLLGEAGVELAWPWRGGCRSVPRRLVLEPLVHLAVGHAVIGIVDHERGELGLEEARAGMAAVVADHHAAGQAGIATVLELLQPRAHGGVADAGAQRVAGVHEVLALLVRALGGVHAS